MFFDEATGLWLPSSALYYSQYSDGPVSRYPKATFEVRAVFTVCAHTVLPSKWFDFCPNQS
jgi:hypothetical protein